MIGRRYQAGATAVLIVLVLVLVLIGVLASVVLSRLGGSSRDDTQTVTRLSAAADALDQFAGSASRMPCPADPALDTGEEVLPAVGGATCSFPEGTLPWKTLGMRRDDAFDAWGRKLSYRVYTGNVAGAGSLVRPGGASMVDCDTVEPSPGGVDAAGLCRADHSTTAAQFVAGKGLLLDDLGTAVNAAYVVLSHGSTGLGGYTVSGARLDLPVGAQRNNTNATGPFTIRAFSEADTSATVAGHFDDLLVYRTVPDLAKRANLVARDWPESASPSVAFDAPTIAAALSQASVSPGDLGRASIDFGSFTVQGFTGGGTATNLTFDNSGSAPGLGVGSSNGNGMSSTVGEWVRIDLDSKAARFALALSGFGQYTDMSVFTERVEIRFYNDGVMVGSPMQKSACNTGDGLAAFSLAPSGEFNRVEIAPLEATDVNGVTNETIFVLAEIKACAATESTCTASLANATTTCP